MPKAKKKIVIGLLIAAAIVLIFFLSSSPKIDELVIAEAQRQGIPKENIELVQDYGIGEGESPYLQIYKDKESNKHFAVISQLPMVNTEGEEIKAAWKRSGNGYVSDVNLFKAEVAGNSVSLNVLNDQPTGAKIGDNLKFSPQLFLNGEEKIPSEPVLLSADPLNENYSNNVLEWDYGIAKRRLRIIEGSVLGSWVFDSNPGGDVEIKYNQEGDFKLKLGEYASSEDTEFVSSKIFNNVEYPFIVSDTATFYPNADTETVSVDGYVMEGTSDMAWTTKRNATIATSGSDSANGASFPTMYIQASNSSNLWNGIVRAGYLFDTSSIPDTALISDAQFSVYQFQGTDVDTFNQNVVLTSFNPEANTAISLEDYDQFGTTDYSNRLDLGTIQSHANGYEPWTLNSSGISAINKSGVTKLGMRFSSDIDNSITWASGSSRLYAYFAEQGTGYQPKLVVTYTFTPFATGGTVTYVGDYEIHTFTSSGTFTASAPGTVEYLVVGGGGGGESDTGGGGGGGGGQVRTGTLSITAGAKTVTVGLGGPIDSTGQSSVFDSITSVGGAGGNYPKGGTSGSGVSGGNAATDGSTYLNGGGGGGDSVVGGNANASGGGNGGAGTASSISGSSVYYGGGGGGGGYLGSTTGGTGGLGGGGNGAPANGVATAGTPNTGGGGGGRKYSSGAAAGGSGIVIVRYQSVDTCEGNCVMDSFTNSSMIGSSSNITISGGSATLVSLLANGAVCTLASQCSSGYCYRDADSDGYGATTGEKVCKAAASAGTDCYDSNANAKPGQTAYYTVNRGDGSFDYDCSGSAVTNPSTCTGHTGCSLGPSQNHLACCSSSSESCSSNVYTASGCGVTWTDSYCSASSCSTTYLYYPPVGDWVCLPGGGPYTTYSCATASRTCSCH